jgi:hypothetical protein
LTTSATSVRQYRQFARCRSNFPFFSGLERLVQVGRHYFLARAVPPAHGPFLGRLPVEIFGSAILV